jgi:hypothetical protein
MRHSRVWLGVLVAVAFIGYLLWSTLAAQAAECHVCVAFQGHRNCATASAATPTEAARQSQTTACGIIAQGMNDKIACDNVPPISRECRTK